MLSMQPVASIVFLVLLGVIAVTAMVVGVILASDDYSSAAAFSIAGACVGVLGTMAGQKMNGGAIPGVEPKGTTYQAPTDLSGKGGVK